ncbi:MAG: hypothetical protein E6Q32_03070 [Neisseriales bacterium]|nr:MAG: hypothetical protein E6Q32_03070 [Neisseriales bacterium]
MSEFLSAGYKTLRKWITIYETTGSCKLIKSDLVGRKRLFDNKDAILDYLKLHPDSDGKELRNALAPHVTQSCFYNTLNQLDITYKKEVKYKKRCVQKRNEYASVIKELDINNLVYIDKTGVDNNMSKLRGWSGRGCKSFTEALGFRNKRITLIAGYCYGTKELVASMEYDGYTNSDVFLTWVE